jgi:SsrA-binding protein
VIVRGGEAFLIGAHIPPFQTTNTPTDYDPLRNRRLILHKEEIKRLAELDIKKGKGNGGMTIIPISLYNNKHRIKVDIAIARGKKKADKRQTIKKRETEREMRREMK